MANLASAPIILRFTTNQVNNLSCCFHDWFICFVTIVNVCVVSRIALTPPFRFYRMTLNFFFQTPLGSMFDKCKRIVGTTRFDLITSLVDYFEVSHIYRHSVEKFWRLWIFYFCVTVRHWYNNINNQLYATITNFIDNYNQLNMFWAIISPILRSTRLCL